MAKVTRLDYDKVAMILVEAFLFGDKEAANRNGLTIRTIQNYKTLLRENSEVSNIFAIKRSEIESAWADEIKSAVIAGIDFIKRAAQQSDPKDPDSVHAIAGALKIISGIGLTKELVDARIRAISGDNPFRQEDRLLDISNSDN